MKNNREMEGPKYKRNKEKNQGSFLLFKILLRLIHKKRKREKEERE